MLDILHRYFRPTSLRLWIVVQLVAVSGLHYLLTMQVPWRGEDEQLESPLPFSSLTVLFAVWCLFLAGNQMLAELSSAPADGRLRRGIPHWWLPADSLLCALLVVVAGGDFLGSPPDRRGAWLLYGLGIVELLRVTQLPGRVVRSDSGVSIILPERHGERIVAKLPATGSNVALDIYDQLVIGAAAWRRTVVLDSRPGRHGYEAVALPLIVEFSPPPAREAIADALRMRRPVDAPLAYLRATGWAWSFLLVAVVAAFDGGGSYALGRYVWVFLGAYFTALVVGVGWSFVEFRAMARRLATAGSATVLDGARSPALLRWSFWLLGAAIAMLVALRHSPLGASFEIVDAFMSRLDRDDVLPWGLASLLVVGRCRAELERSVRRGFHALTRLCLDDGDVIVERPMAFEVRRYGAAEVRCSAPERPPSIRFPDGRQLSGRLVGERSTWRAWTQALAKATASGYR